MTEESNDRNNHSTSATSSNQKGRLTRSIQHLLSVAVFGGAILFFLCNRNLMSAKPAASITYSADQKKEIVALRNSSNKEEGHLRQGTLNGKTEPTNTTSKTVASGTETDKPAPKPELLRKGTKTEPSTTNTMQSEPPIVVEPPKPSSPLQQQTPHQLQYTREMKSSKENPIYQNGTSPRWYPSEQWLHNCTRDLAPISLDQGQWQNPYQEMAIGDCIKFCHCSEKRHGNTTFNFLYRQHACDSGTWAGSSNLTVVEAIHRNQSLQPGFHAPHPETLVVHLRLGDVVEEAKDNLVTMLLNGSDPGHKARNFRKALKSAREILDNLYDSGKSTIHIVGGSHKVEFYAKSRVYAGCLYRSVQAAGFYEDEGKSNMTIEHSHPQQDFFYISHAKHLVVSAGGFSNLMGKMVERRGGTIWGRAFGIQW